MPLTITRANPGDEELVADLGIRTYLDHYADLWTPAGLHAYLQRNFEVAQLRREIEEGHAVEYFIARDSQTPLGFAKLRANRPLPPVHERSGVELEKIYFLRDTTGHGRGAQLMHHLFDHVLARNDALIWLDVLKSNTRGIAFYERLGFARHAEIPFRSDTRDVGMWVMTRDLP